MLKRICRLCCCRSGCCAVFAFSLVPTRKRGSHLSSEQRLPEGGDLANPAHDAQDVSESLKRFGFTVNTVTDADFDGFGARCGISVEWRRMRHGGFFILPVTASRSTATIGCCDGCRAFKSDVDARTEAIGLRSAMDAVAAAKTLAW